MHKPPAFPNLPVLVVDDSPFARRIIRGMLEPVGIRHVIEAPDGAEALQRLTQFKPGLIVLDWNLPVLSAYDLLSVLRDPSRSAETAIPVIVVTSAPTRGVIEKAAQRDVIHVLRKPFAPKALWQRIACFYNQLEPVIDVRAGLEQPLLIESRPVPPPLPAPDPWELGSPRLTAQ
jgi:two-component system, chemotaxis family, chemotaxis protein CheY